MSHLPYLKKKKPPSEGWLKNKKVCFHEGNTPKNVIPHLLSHNCNLPTGYTQKRENTFTKAFSLWVYLFAILCDNNTITFGSTVVNKQHYKILLLSIYFFENIYTVDISCYNDDTEITERLTVYMKFATIYQTDRQR